MRQNKRTPFERRCNGRIGRSPRVKRGHSDAWYACSDVHVFAASVKWNAVWSRLVFLGEGLLALLCSLAGYHAEPEIVLHLETLPMGQADGKQTFSHLGCHVVGWDRRLANSRDLTFHTVSGCHG